MKMSDRFSDINQSFDTVVERSSIPEKVSTIYRVSDCILTNIKFHSMHNKHRRSIDGSL